MKIEGKYSLELNYPGDERLFLNFWNHSGPDVVVEIRDGKLYRSRYDEAGNELPEAEITFAEYLKLVEDSILNSEY